MSFSKALRMLRIENDISLNELARNVNIDVSTLSRYESTPMKPSAEYFKRIADYFHMSSDDLYKMCDELDA